MNLTSKNIFEYIFEIISLFEPHANSFQFLLYPCANVSEKCSCNTSFSNFKLNSFIIISLCNVTHTIPFSKTFLLFCFGECSKNNSILL